MGKIQTLKKAAAAVPKTTNVSGAVQPCAKAGPTEPASDFKCVKYKRGPKYINKANQQPLASYDKWDQLIRDGKLTQEEVKIMKLMSPNEGDFNAVQGYDSEAITAGAMQKTINPQGDGELVEQIKEFKAENPAKYQTLFADKGWEIVDVPVKKTVGKGKKKKVVETTEQQIQFSYKNSKGETVVVRKNELKNFIHSYCDPATDKETKAGAEKALNAMREAMEDEAMKEKQLLDFKERIDGAVGQTPQGYKQPISDYMSSPKGRALVLDQSVNRPAYVKTDFGSALDTFYKNNPNASRNPAEWGDKRAQYEDEINELYGPNRRGTDMPNRYDKIKNQSLPDDIPM